MGMEDRVRWWGDMPHFYGPQDLPPRNKRIESAIYGIQRTLKRYGADCRVNGRYEEYTRRAVAYFQGTVSHGKFDRHRWVDESGEFNRGTAMMLFGIVASEVEAEYELPKPYLHSFFTLEGVWDNGAIGLNGYDTGLVQINRKPGVHRPTPSLMNCCDPAFAARWAAARLRGRHSALKNWDAALLGHRAPAWAEAWVGMRPWPEGYYDPKKKLTAQDVAEAYVEFAQKLAVK